MAAIRLGFAASLLSFDRALTGLKKILSLAPGIMTEDSETHESGFWLPPETILQDRYLIKRVLGSGGMGVVYKALDLRLGHAVAVKQMQREDSALGKQFECEARLMAQLNHPVLPRTSDYFIEGKRAFLVMQYIDGDNLAELVAQRRGPLPQHAVIAWADQLLDALVYLHSHERQIIHRDIKPHNLKVTTTGKIALLDFGLAKSQTADTPGLALHNSIFGFSPRYAPLEQIQDLGTTPQSDIFALGATLYHLLTGHKPPDALTRASALIAAHPNPLKTAAEINPAIAPELSAILSRAMEQNPHERFRSAKEFREALRRLGRVDENDELEFVPRPVAVDATVSSNVELDLFRFIRRDERTRINPKIGAMILIMLLAYGAFCYYYPWKLPSDPSMQSQGARGLSVKKRGSQ